MTSNCATPWLRTLTPTPAPRPGPRQQRGRFKARAPMARKLCLGAPMGEGLCVVVRFELRESFGFRARKILRGGTQCSAVLPQSF
ncbi:hypothetical protein XCV4286 [Xanthomonas euvesicatoria pv. vesicatoria str. 85-10]|uniref:Uncharacterized protein n=4 Tax=Xanthomonas TaxID=338 RepID=Q3BMJ6_XANE5|nr:hypothetical protein XCV4286 [Xanthomonas euvesicatoria pv. vesicatoria str. 85-10]